LLSSEFAAQHRAEYEIMKIALKTVKAKHSCNLGPVTYFVRQDMDNNLLRRCLQGPTNKLEVPLDVPAWGREAFDEVFETLPTLLTQFKKGFKVDIRNRGGIGERFVRKPFNVPLLSRKNVLHDVADGLIVAVRPHIGLESFTMMAKLIMPFLPFPVRVTNEYVAINLHLSPHYAPDALSASLQEQRGTPRRLRH
jgi:hypothetical protein